MHECITALKGSPYLPQQLDQVVRACMLPIFRYGAALVNWTDPELDLITNKWAQARRLAWKLAPGTLNALHLLEASRGGGHIPSAKVLWVKEMLQLISMCRAHDDELRTLMHWEWGESRKWIGFVNDDECARELT